MDTESNLKGQGIWQKSCLYVERRVQDKPISFLAWGPVCRSGIKEADKISGLKGYDELIWLILQGIQIAQHDSLQ